MNLPAASYRVSKNLPSPISHLMQGEGIKGRVIFFIHPLLTSPLKGEEPVR
jgi:hypothetical protein